MLRTRSAFFFFFFNDTATTEIYTLSLHDALPIYHRRNQDGGTIGSAAGSLPGLSCADPLGRDAAQLRPGRDRKSTRLNSSHGYISYAVFCLKKKTKSTPTTPAPTLPTSTCYFNCC